MNGSLAPNNMKNVIIIPVHNQHQLFTRCIEAVYKKTKDPYVIVVNDGSDNETTEIINNDKRINHIIHHKQAHGFSGACNAAMQYAIDNLEFTALCLLNSDTEVITDNWFDRVLFYFNNDPKIGIASVMSNNALAQSVTESYLKTIDSKPSVYTVFAHGFCYFISKALIEKIGLFDVDVFPHYGSEDDYSLRTVKSGFRVLLAGNVYVWHKNNGTYTESQRTAIVAKSLPNLQEKHGKGFVNLCMIKTVQAAEYLKKK